MNLQTLPSFTLLVCWLFVVVFGQTCNPLLPHCKEQGQLRPSATKPKCKPRYLIAGKATDCTKPGRQKIIDIDSSTVVIRPNPPQLPGCFSIDFEVNIHGNNLPRSIFAKLEFTSFNIPQISKLPCFNASDNGCGGYGNNCYYCDVCNALKDLQSTDNSRVDIVSQFRDVKCPQIAGRYKIHRQVCFDNYGDLDKDGNCELDFLEKDDSLKAYRQAFETFEKAGFGTIAAKVTFAHNATAEQLRKRIDKERYIKAAAEQDIEKKSRKSGWKLSPQEQVEFKKWFIKQRQDAWHRQDYLPWLLYHNEIGCMSLYFTVCDKKPVPITANSGWMSSGQAWQCA